MFNLSFLRPLFLGAMAFTAIPVLIHLLHRRNVPVLQFSLVQFLLQSHRRRQKFLRLHNLLLLAVRIGILALLALLFASPVLFARWLPFFTREVPVSRIVLLDDSPSMALRDARSPTTPSLWKRAQSEALAVLDNQRPQDEVLVLLASQATRGQSGKLHPPYSGDKRLIEESSPYMGTVNMTRAIETAVTLLDGAGHVDRELCVVSDFFSSSFTDFKTLRINPKISVKTIDVSTASPDNVAVEDVSFTPSIIAQGQPVTFSVRAVNTGVVPRLDYPVTFTVNGIKVQEQRCSLQPDRAFEFTFVYRFETSGVNEVTFSGGADDYLPDNSFDATVAVSDVFFVLAVSGTTSPVRSDDEVFYLNTSLNPLDVPDLEQGMIIQPVRITPEELQTVDLNRFDVVCLADVGSLASEAVDRLESYVESGGGLALFPGESVVPQVFNATIGELAPAPLVEAVGDLNDQDSVFHLSDLDVNHPVFAAFQGSTARSLSIPNFHRFFTIHHEAFSAETRVLARFDRESPALIERKIGKGTCIMAAFPVDADWSDLPHHPVFPPLVHQIFHYLNRQRMVQERPVTAGNPFHRSVSETSPGMVIILHRPTGTAEQIKLKATSRLFFIDIPDTAPPGHYRLELVYPEMGREETLRFATTIPAEESRFDPLSPEAMKALGGKGQTVTPRSDLLSWPLQTPLALLLIGFLCMENVVCALYTRRWSE